MPRCVHRGSESLAAKYRFGMCPNFRESASRWMDQYSNHWNAQEQCLRGCRCLAHSVCGWCFHPPLHSERMEGGNSPSSFSIQSGDKFGNGVNRCRYKIVSLLLTRISLCRLGHFAYTFQSNFCSGLSQRQGTSTIYDSRRGSSGFELWESLSSGHVTTRLGSMSPQRLRSPRLTLATKKLSTGANGQKEDAASFSCRRSTVSSLIDLPVSLMLDAQGYDLPIVAFGVRGTGHEYLFARAG